MLVRDGDGNLHIGLPIKFRNEPGRLEPQVPGLGQHTGEVLKESGLPAALIADVLGDDK